MYTSYAYNITILLCVSYCKAIHVSVQYMSYVHVQFNKRCEGINDLYLSSYLYNYMSVMAGY